MISYCFLYILFQITFPLCIQFSAGLFPYYNSRVKNQKSPTYKISIIKFY
jgi:hypothetical protein